jgi:hypothetical protein
MADEDKQIMQGMLDSAVQRVHEANVANLAELRNELIERMDRLERRIERVEINTNSMLMQLAGISKSLTECERRDNSTAATLAAQQRAIDDPARRVAELERRAS